jgi:putative hydrolase
MLERMLREGAADPQVAAALRSMGVDPDDPRTMAAMNASLRTFLNPATRPSGEQTARDAARAACAAAGPDPVVAEPARRHVEEAVAVAQLWLDPVTTLGAPMAKARALSRAEWVDATMAQWDELVEPVAAGISAAISSAMKGQIAQLSALTPDDLADLTLPEGLAGLPGAEGLGSLLENPAALADMVRQMEPVMGQLSSAFVAGQTGLAVGTLATDMVSGTEVGLPLMADGSIALLPANVAETAAGLSLDEGEVRLYLAVRETARARLFAGVPWLGPALLGAVQDYARNISIDTDAIEESVAGIDLGGLGSADLDAIRAAVQDRLFAPTPTPAQQGALTRLETLLALAEGWVDHVTAAAVEAHLPHAAALGEAARRRRAGGPAEKAFSALVGLQLRPRRLRDAANLWAAVEADSGAAARDARWAHPDVAPTVADLDDPLGYVDRARGESSGDGLDAELESLLRSAEGQPPDADDSPTS